MRLGAVLSQEGSCTCRQPEGRKPREEGAGFFLPGRPPLLHAGFSLVVVSGVVSSFRVRLLLVVASLVAALELRPSNCGTRV